MFTPYLCSIKQRSKVASLKKNKVMLTIINNSDTTLSIEAQSAIRSFVAEYDSQIEEVKVVRTKSNDEGETYDIYFCEQDEEPVFLASVDSDGIIHN